ncbi:uncharacterized protein LOC120184579 [Hibiscus syriacus]|uniref:uncharacterized protein LOC120184579 n=1 Tax=Hibiscus syriacus TaxID=106335 RepID=UPI0019236745|nr:uncharacterized protein LOC120184579 [Hibiscus syriacus]
MGGSRNKFEILNSIDPESLLPIEDFGRKQRVAYFGVAKIVQDLKLKKEHVEKVKKLEDRGGASSSSIVPCAFGGKNFCITAVYDSNDGSTRRQLWNQLNSLGCTVGNMPWLIGCDLNLILSAEESSVYQDTNLTRKLDRVLVNSNWIETFPELYVEFQAPGDSDHCPTLVWLHKEAPIARYKPFKFFNFWAMHPEFLSIVEKSWSTPIVGNPTQLEVERELKILEEAELLFYKQKAKVNWIKEGGRAAQLGSFMTKLELGLTLLKTCPTRNKGTIWGQGNDKSPGLDGYNPYFFKKAWPIVGEDFKAAISMISKNQTAFVKGRSIADNTLLAQELGLPDKFIDWIWACFTKPSYSVVFNGSLVGYFRGARGVRQGSIDSIIGVQSVLDVFYTMSGLKLNASKCEIYVVGIYVEQCIDIRWIKGFKIGKLPVRYLGIPLVTKKLAEKDCQCLIDKIQTKLNLWVNRQLSFAGRLQLVRVVLFSIANYWCRQIMLPLAVIKKIEQLCYRFFWKGDDLPAKVLELVGGKFVC